MNNDKLKEANALDFSIKAHQRTINELDRLVKGARVISVSRPEYNGPVKIETSMSVYEISNVGDDKFADRLWDLAARSVVTVRDMLAGELDMLNGEFEKL